MTMHVSSDERTTHQFANAGVVAENDRTTVIASRPRIVRESAGLVARPGPLGDQPQVRGEMLSREQGKAEKQGLTILRAHPSTLCRALRQTKAPAIATRSRIDPRATALAGRSSHREIPKRHDERVCRQLP